MTKQHLPVRSRSTRILNKTHPVSASSRPVQITGVTEWQDGKVARFEDYLVEEEPLEIRIGTRPISVTMRTPGQDLELHSGFLLTEGVIKRVEQIANLRQVVTGGHKRNVVRVDLARGVAPKPAFLQRNFLMSSSCGLCGKASINAVRVRGIVRPNPQLRVSPDVLCLLPDALRSAQPLFGRTGGLHAAALFDPTGKLIALREDVGNAFRSATRSCSSVAAGVLKSSRRLWSRAFPLWPASRRPPAWRCGWPGNST